MSLASKLLDLIESTYPSELTYIDPDYFIKIKRKTYRLSSDDKDALQKLRKLDVESKWGNPDQTLQAVKEKGSVRISIGKPNELKKMNLEEV